MKFPVAFSLLLAAACAVPAIAQSNPPALWEVGAGYNFVHTNAPPSGCGCFSMNGGTASIARPFTPSFSIVGEFNGITNGNVNASGHSLTLLSYLAGPRYRLSTARGRFSPFAQALVGGVHASGALYAPSGSASGSANAFAASVGGGLDVALNRHVALRLVEADYLLTLLPNGVNSRQNNLNLTTGVVFRFGTR
jgi:peptidoglycan-associated lipoprotein